MPNPTPITEWAKECELAGHGPYRHSVISLPKDHPSKLALCPECADAHARQQVEAFRESHRLGIEIEEEVGRARTLYPQIQSSPHEGYAVILEELDELWQEVKASKPGSDRDAMRKEALQVAAMAVRFIQDVCDAAAIRALKP